MQMTRDCSFQAVLEQYPLSADLSRNGDRTENVYIVFYNEGVLKCHPMSMLFSQDGPIHLTLSSPFARLTIRQVLRIEDITSMQLGPPIHQLFGGSQQLLLDLVAQGGTGLPLLSNPSVHSVPPRRKTVLAAIKYICGYNREDKNHDDDDAYPKRIGEPPLLSPGNAFSPGAVCSTPPILSPENHQTLSQTYKQYSEILPLTTGADLWRRTDSLIGELQYLRDPERVDSSFAPRISPQFGSPEFADDTGPPRELVYGSAVEGPVGIGFPCELISNTSSNGKNNKSENSSYSVSGTLISSRVTHEPISPSNLGLVFQHNPYEESSPLRQISPTKRLLSPRHSARRQQSAPNGPAFVSRRHVDGSLVSPSTGKVPADRRTTSSRRDVNSRFRRAVFQKRRQQGCPELDNCPEFSPILLDEDEIYISEMAGQAAKAVTNSDGSHEQSPDPHGRLSSCRSTPSGVGVINSSGGLTHWLTSRGNREHGGRRYSGGPRRHTMPPGRPSENVSDLILKRNGSSMGMFKKLQSQLGTKILHRFKQSPEFAVVNCELLDFLDRADDPRLWEDLRFLSLQWAHVEAPLLIITKDPSQTSGILQGISLVYARNNNVLPLVVLGDLISEHYGR